MWNRRSEIKKKLPLSGRYNFVPRLGYLILRNIFITKAVTYKFMRVKTSLALRLSGHVSRDRRNDGYFTERPIMHCFEKLSVQNANGIYSNGLDRSGMFYCATYTVGILIKDTGRVSYIVHKLFFCCCTL